MTFELFAFEKKQTVGIVRVRNEVWIEADGTLSGDSVVDFIEPSGTVIEGIGTGTFTGRRIEALGLD